MSFRRRHRWFRRFALGLALLTTASLAGAPFAAAKRDEGAAGVLYVSTPGWSGLVDSETGVPLSAGIDGDVLQPLALPVVGEEVVSKAIAGGERIAVATAATRPDDLAGRFAHSEVAPAPTPADDNVWTFERGDVLIVAIGSLVLVLGLGLALGYIRRPRLAGL